jgi:hypothetical protein
MFRAMFSHTISSTWLYLQYLVVFIHFTAVWCLGRFETQFQIIQDPNRQQLGRMQSSAPDDGRKHWPKHVELTRNNKLTCTFVSRWLLS